MKMKKFTVALFVVLCLAQWLVPAAQVDDREPAHGDAAVAVDVHALVVGPSVARDVAHGRQQRLLCLPRELRAGADGRVTRSTLGRLRELSRRVNGASQRREQHHPARHDLCGREN